MNKAFVFHFNFKRRPDAIDESAFDGIHAVEPFSATFSGVEELFLQGSELTIIEDLDFFVLVIT